jgi:hypothetical protein
MSRRVNKVRKPVVWKRRGNLRVTADQALILDDVLDTLEDGDNIRTTFWYCWRYSETRPLMALKRRKILTVSKRNTSPGEYEFDILFAAKGWKELGLPHLQNVRSLRDMQTHASNLGETAQRLSESGYRIRRFKSQYSGAPADMLKKLQGKVRYFRRVLTQVERNYAKLKVAVQAPAAVDMDTLKADIVAATLGV